MKRISLETHEIHVPLVQMFYAYNNACEIPGADSYLQRGCLSYLLEVKMKAIFVLSLERSTAGAFTAPFMV